jgi:adenosylmethionine-8-amino-7-oxononanoate aminotransferase
MEAAMKLARQYFVESSQPQRIRFIARKQSYHGNTLGALGMSGHKGRRNVYEPMLSPLISHISPCYEYRERWENERTEDYVDRLAAELDEEFQSWSRNCVCVCS